ncbi:MAG: Asp-tRNA(Asn)/Glu-tRNA(Gln) amidotransferase subunit GatA [Candidatus Omnitrophica bacterium]|nr:Asp-tRNA(Asn)/Glu-tRNA(Gln) amidotransferase subunit GatA [Candidatus Omnitrophota bacterium]
MELWQRSGNELLGLLKSGQVKPTEVAASFIKRYQQTDDKVKAFVLTEPEKILDQARKLETQKPEGKLYGLPIGIKDLICVEDEPTTCASHILKDFCPPYNAGVIENLKAEQAVLFGKTNMDEFAFGSSTESSYYHITRNPWNTDKVPGGSSGGSAACVAAGQVGMALGSDTGGSIRQPASFCGVVGMKPTYGRVSRYGLIAFASSLDQIGPMTGDVTDAALLLEVISGWDKRDSTSAKKEVPDYTAGLNKDIKGLKIGLPKEYIIPGMDKQVEESVQEGIKKLEALGAQTVEISLPHTEYAVAVYYIAATSEASSNLARYDGVRYGLREVDGAKGKNDLVDMYYQTRSKGFGQEAKRRIILGTYALSSGYYDAYYLKAQKVRTLIKNDFDQAFKKCDLIVTPTAPTPAFGAGEKTEDPLSMYLSDIFTIPVNLAGIPAVSLPCGFSDKGLPIGLQIIGRAFDEQRILQTAYAFEQNTDHHKKRPKIV